MNEKPKLQVYERRNYGQSALYPAGPLANAISRLTGRKTLIESDISALRDLGFDFELIHDPRSAAASLIGGAR